MWADFHWHGRDLREKRKETVKHSLELAYASGGVALGMMPNTLPRLTSKRTCKRYLNLAKEADIPEGSVKLYTHIGITKKYDQIMRAVDAVREVPGICGIKMFAGRSTGNLGIIHYDDQGEVWETLAQAGYEGVVVCHLEKEMFMQESKYNPNNRKTWSTHARPEIAEIGSFDDMYEQAGDVHFQGKIHVAHVSTLPVVDFIAQRGNDYTDAELSCGLTLHHATRSNHWLTIPDGVWYKCNPPLRSQETQEGLLERLLDGRIPILESDHAPHTSKDKHPKRGLPASGITSGTGWPYMRKFLRGKQMIEKDIDNVMFHNVVELYGLEDEIEPVHREVDKKRFAQLREFYDFDPFRNFK